GFLGIWRPSFVSPFGLLLPVGLTETGYGREILQRTIGRPDWFFGWRYFRVSSVFLYSTMHATASAFMVPILAYVYTRAKGKGKLGCLMGLWLVALSLIGSTGRMAILGLA